MISCVYVCIYIYIYVCMLTFTDASKLIVLQLSLEDHAYGALFGNVRDHDYFRGIHLFHFQHVYNTALWVLLFLILLCV